MQLSAVRRPRPGISVGTIEAPRRTAPTTVRSCPPIRLP